MPFTDEEVRALMKWQGQLDAVIRELNHNDDHLQRVCEDLSNKCISFTVAIAELKTLSREEAKRWALIASVASGIIVTILTTIITRAL